MSGSLDVVLDGLGKVVQHHQVGPLGVGGSERQVRGVVGGERVQLACWRAGVVVLGELCGCGVVEDGDAPDQCLAAVDVVGGQRPCQERVQVAAAGEGVVDGGDQGRPPRAGAQLLCSLSADQVAQSWGP
ncbi:MAG: hypothetical protein ACYCTH_01390 [Cellulomonas sp.]